MTTMTTTLNDPRRLDVPTLAERLRTGAAPRLLDVRTPAEFESAHIPGSYNVPLDTLREHREELRHHLDEDVVLICRSGVRAEQAEKALAEVGLPGLHLLLGGISGWESAGAPLNRGRETWDLERQVRFTAGSLAAAGVLGSVAVPRLKWLAGGVGAGLVFAALSNSCAMGNVLSRMPWNRRTEGRDVNDLVRTLEDGA